MGSATIHGHLRGTGPHDPAEAPPKHCGRPAVTWLTPSCRPRQRDRAVSICCGGSTPAAASGSRGASSLPAIPCLPSRVWPAARKAGRPDRQPRQVFDRELGRRRQRPAGAQPERPAGPPGPPGPGPWLAVHGPGCGRRGRRVRELPFSATMAAGAGFRGRPARTAAARTGRAPHPRRHPHQVKGFAPDVVVVDCMMDAGLQAAHESDPQVPSWYISRTPHS